MMPIVSRLLLPLLALLLLLPTPAAAQVSIQDWLLHRLSPEKLLDEQKERDEFFNVGNCECEVPMALEVKLQGEYQTADYEFQIVAGQACLDTTNNTIRDKNAGCRVLFGPVRFSAWKQATWTISQYKGSPLTAKILMADLCSGQDQKSFAIAMYTEPAKDQKWQEDATKLTYTVDTQGPAQAKNPSLKAGEGQVTISFDAPYSTSSSTDGGTTSGETDIKYQVLCEKLDGTLAFTSPPAEAGYDVCTSPGTTTTPDGGAIDGSSGASWSSPWPKPRAGDGSTEAGPLDFGPDTGAVDAGNPETAPATDGNVADAGPPDSAPAADSGTSSGAKSLDTAYVCSGTQNTASKIVVDGLANGESYRFYLVTIDKARNPSTPLPVGEGAPELAEDLWERYKRLGGKAESGYCFVATAVHGSYDHPHVRVLRELRDQVLLPTSDGRLFVQLYYATSPSPAAWIADHESARTLVRAALWPVTLAAAAHLYTSAWHKALVLVVLFLGVGIIVGRTRGGRTTGGRRS